jgi:hypothetical protein
MFAAHIHIPVQGLSLGPPRLGIFKALAQTGEFGMKNQPTTAASSSGWSSSCIAATVVMRGLCIVAKRGMHVLTMTTGLDSGERCNEMNQRGGYRRG